MIIKIAINFLILPNYRLPQMSLVVKHNCQDFLYFLIKLDYVRKTPIFSS